MRFELTCSESPEQYDVFNDQGDQIAYIRLRYGYVTATVPGVFGDVVFESRTKGFNKFEDDERPVMLAAIRSAISKHDPAATTSAGPWRRGSFGEFLYEVLAVLPREITDPWTTRPRLFYYSQAAIAWLPFNAAEVVAEIEDLIENGEPADIQYKYVDMSVFQYQSLKEAF